MNARRGDAFGAQPRDLIVHQRHKRRYHDCEPVRKQRRDLVAQRLARPRRHDDQHVRSGRQQIHDLLLSGTERGIAEHVVKDLSGSLAHKGSPFESRLASVGDSRFSLLRVVRPARAQAFGSSQSGF